MTPRMRTVLELVLIPFTAAAITPTDSVAQVQPIRRANPLRVTAEVFRPVYERDPCPSRAGPCAPIRDHGFTTNVIDATVDRSGRFNTPLPYSDNLAWVPGSLQLVSFWARGAVGTYLCGEAYTGPAGDIDEVINCGALPAGPVEIFMQVQTDNALGFRVLPYQMMGGPSSYVWESPGVPYADSLEQIDFGRQDMDNGGVAAFDWTAAWIGPFTEAVAFSIETLHNLLIPIPQSTWYVGAFYGSPTTVWNEVFMTSNNGAGGNFSQRLWSVPHELGHVIYNHLHSDRVHYDVEVTHYARNHSRCQRHDPKFAHYEGFANYVRDLVWRLYDPANYERSDAGTAAFGARRLGDCATPPPPGAADTTGRGAHREGNVQDFLYALAFGFDGMDNRPAASMNQLWDGGRGYFLISPAEIVNAVGVVGPASHDLFDLWNLYLSPRSRTPIPGAVPVPGVAVTADFQCFAQSSLLEPNDLVRLGLTGCTPPGAPGDNCFEDLDCWSGICDQGAGNPRLCIPRDGDGAIGDYCTHNNQCGNVNCVGNECRARVGIGEPCETDAGCSGGRRCDGVTFRCIPNDGEGATGDYCTHNHHCGNLNCVGNLCRAPVGIGEPCETDAGCSGGRRCDGVTLRCIPNDDEGEVGDYCTHNHHCENLNCVGNLCRARVGIGEPCETDAGCSGGRRCDGVTFRCIPNNGEGATGDYCTHDHHCRVGECRGTQCRAPADLGSYCLTDAGCRSGRCDAAPGNPSRCIPNDGEGQVGDYCTHLNHCDPSQNLFCSLEYPGARWGYCRAP